MAPEPSDHQIDEAILSVAVSRWQKVAMVIVRVAKILGERLPDIDAGRDLVAKRIENLVEQNRLLAQGDVRRWRHSEVRKPD